MGRRHGQRDRGTAILEFALVAPILFALFAAVIDFGLAYRKSNEVSSTIRSAVRVEVSLGDDRAAEFQALTALNAGIAEIGAANVLRVIVFESTTADGALPTACNLTPSSTGQGVAGVCNVYGPAQLSTLAANSAKFSGSTTACQSDDWDRFYCPVAREADQSDGPDYVGVWVEFRVRWVIGVIPGGGRTTNDRAVMRIEPSL